MTERQSKATQERHERILNELVKMPGNDLCADCGAKNPRWASYSLGVFLCIRCAGIHRKMGTHISKIKSITMDQWTVEQIDMMRNSGGNSVVNSKINPNNQPLPIGADDDHAIEKYIRAKWEKHLFMIPKKTALPIIQTPPKRSSSVPVHMQPKDDVQIQNPLLQQQQQQQQQQPVLPNQFMLTDDQKIDQLVKLGFTDRAMNVDALRRAGGNVDIAATILTETRTNNVMSASNLFSTNNMSPVSLSTSNPLYASHAQSLGNTLPMQSAISTNNAQANPFTSHLSSGLMSQQQQQQPSSMFISQQQQQANSVGFPPQPNTGNMFATQQTSFSLQQNNGALFPVQQQQQTTSPFMQQSNPTTQVSVNVNDPFNIAPNNFANPLPNNVIGNLNAGYNSTPLFNTINNHGQPQQFSSAPNTPFQAPVTSNPFSQMNTSYTTPIATTISNQPGNNTLPFMKQPFNNNNVAINPWSTNPSF
ncbi:ArfGap-domain-containing protein [Rhizopus microsporus]|uniref:ArfGap-domain-containing protein n=1 Tax=Rhizopus microsporus TaxID=58291 RepID=A0A1X0S7J5_RHIZD|nr:ArfGap-domain-containing protein [Rhizopus microsporus]